jgi:hypothetical protein
LAGAFLAGVVALAAETFFAGAFLASVFATVFSVTPAFFLGAFAGSLFVGAFVGGSAGSSDLPPTNRFVTAAFKREPAEGTTDTETSQKQS